MLEIQMEKQEMFKMSKQRFHPEDCVQRNFQETFQEFEEKMKEYEEISVEIKQISADISLGSLAALNEAETIKDQVFLY